MTKKPNTPTPVTEDLEQEMLRALLVQNEALLKASEMLHSMNKILNGLLEQRASLPPSSLTCHSNRARRLPRRRSS